MLENVTENIKIAQEKQKNIYDRKHSNPPKFDIGTKVLKKDFWRKRRAGGCLDSRWLGPFEVTKDAGKGFFSLKNLVDGKLITRIHGIHLKPYLVSSDNNSKLQSSLKSSNHSTPQQSQSPSSRDDHSQQPQCLLKDGNSQHLQSLSSCYVQSLSFL